MFEFGYVGLFLASFLAATVLPFSSEAILSGTIYAGYNPLAALVLATFGNWLGGVSSYYLGYIGKQNWIERYLRIPIKKTELFKLKIKGKEQWVAFFCWLPLVGDVIAVTLGLLKVNAVNVFIGIFIGKALRYIVWAFFTLWLLQ